MMIGFYAPVELPVPLKGKIKFHDTKEKGVKFICDGNRT
jgi:hypothetical protein